MASKHHWPERRAGGFHSGTWLRTLNELPYPIFDMKKLMLALILATVLLAGCTRHYVMVLNNGTRLAITGKPRLEGSAYVYKDIYGKPVYVPASSVRQVAPASMSKSPYDNSFQSDSSK